MVTPLATPSDLEHFLQVAIDADDPAALAALAEASGVARAYCGQMLSLVTDDTLVLNGRGTTAILLPEVPVVAVSACGVDGVPLDPSGYAWTPDGLLYRLAADPYRYGDPWLHGAANISITYSHGYQLIPEDIVGVVVRIAARRYQGGISVVSATGNEGIEVARLGQYDTTYSPPQADTRPFFGAASAWLLLPSEKAGLDPYRHVRLP